MTKMEREIEYLLSLILNSTIEKIDTHVHNCVHPWPLAKSGLRHIGLATYSIYKALSFIYGYHRYIYVYMFLNVPRLARSAFLEVFC